MDILLREKKYITKYRVKMRNNCTQKMGGEGEN